jgi:hypothetical protein
MPRGVPGSGPNAKVETNGDGVVKKRRLGTSSLINVLRGATLDDLDVLDCQIANLEAELKGLKSLRECFAERVLNAVPPVGANGGKVTIMPVSCGTVKVTPLGRHDDRGEAVLSMPETTEQLRDKVVRFLKFGGPTTTGGIKAQFSLELEEVKELMDHEWFFMDHKLWKLSSLGEAHYEQIRGSKS